VKAAHHAQRWILSIAALSTAMLVPLVGHAQNSTGGTTGTTGTFAGTDMFISVQKDKGVNLTDLNRDRFLNRASCICQKPATLKAVVLGSAFARAAAVNPSAAVSMYIGNACSDQVANLCCHRLKSVAFSQFRELGIEADTTVDDLARIWSTTSGNCGETRVPSNLGAGTGGAVGTGGAGGAGGTAGSSATGGTTGTGGTTSTPHGPCDAGVTAFSQTLWIFVGTMGDGSHDIATGTLGFNVDAEPPPVPMNVGVLPANQALLLSWTALSSSTAADLIGYQVLCARGENTQVFKSGTFSAGFDSPAYDPVTCPGGTTTGEWPVSDLPQSSFVCSALLAPSTSSYRLKTLENDINYGVGVAAIDKQRNASVIMPLPGSPVVTKDFYYVYRHQDPQGAASGGFCSVSGDASTGLTVTAGLGGLFMLALAFGRRRPPRSRP
jgi:hypothetical protein